MEKINFVGRPIYYFKSFSYEEDPELQVDGESHTEIHYELVDLKTGKTENGVAFRVLPYYNAEIKAVLDAVNVKSLGEGEYEIDSSISYDQCIQILQSLIDRGIPLSEIDANYIKNEIQLSQNTRKTI